MTRGKLYWNGHEIGDAETLEVLREPFDGKLTISGNWQITRIKANGISADDDWRKIKKFWRDPRKHHKSKGWRKHLRRNK